MTAMPPPSGMWTSSSTTSGSSRADRGDRLVHRAGVGDDVDSARELAADAGAEERVVVDDRDARVTAVIDGRFEHELDLGPAAWRGDDRGPSAVARHPALDRLAQARGGRPGTARAVEAGAAVADVDLDPLAGLGVDVDAVGAGEARGVGHRLARRGDERRDVFVERRGRRRRRPRPATP